MSLVATLTMNPTIDLSTAVDQVEAVRKLRCLGLQRDPGGGGINVARVVQRLGGTAVAVYPAGGLVGKLLHQLMEREEVQSVTVPISGETREDFTVLETQSQQQYRFVLPGPHLHGEEWMACLKTMANLPAPPRFVCVSGSLPPGAPEDFYARVGEIAAEAGARFVIDASGEALRAALDCHIHLMKPNLAELGELVPRALVDDAAIVRGCRDLMDGRRIEAIAVTLGAQGSLLVTRAQAWRARPVAVEAVSAVGAGDSFLGAMVWAQAAGAPLAEAFAYGAAGGTAAVLAAGTELCRSADVRRLAGDIVIDEIAADLPAAAG